MSLSEAAREFAARQRVAHLATADVSAAPHVVPVCYVLIDDHFYFVIDDKPKRSRSGLKRLRNIAENPHVALVIDRYDEDWSHLAFLLVQGLAELVADPTEYTATLGALGHRYPQYRSMPLAFSTHPMIRITPRRWHMWHAGRDTERTTD